MCSDLLRDVFAWECTATVVTSRFFAVRARCTRNYIIKKMFSSWMSASLHVRPVFSSSPTFKFLPCIASMIKKRKENCRISSKSRVPTVKFARWKTGSKATILKQVTQKWRVSDACIILAWWPEKIVLEIVGVILFPLSSTLTERLIWKVIIITVLLSLLIVSFPWDCLKFVLSVVSLFSFRCNVWSWFWNWIQLKHYCSLRLL